MESGLIRAEKEGRNYSYTLNCGVLNQYAEAMQQLSKAAPVYAS
jgi:hypothetical protein